ncbi:MAG: translation elongation factor Ts [Elusimicrobia bacterium]|nr:translation elongation factor Ts [Elusimicrobiota bacterium]
MDATQMIKDLREKTGAGMMDCKRALDEAKGDLPQALTLLRKKGLADAAKKSARVTKEGLVAFALSGRSGAVVELNCETDFVARTPDFQQLAKALAEKAAAGQLRGVEAANEDLVKPLVAKLGENMALRRFERFEFKGAGLIAGYIHLGAKKGALVELAAPSEAAAKAPELAELAKELLLQIVGFSPKYLSRTEVPAADVAREREIHTEILRKEGKPEAQIVKIVEGKINKLFYQQWCLLDQLSVRDNKTSVAELLKAAGAKLGGAVSVVRFARYQLGE